MKNIPLIRYLIISALVLSVGCSNGPMTIPGFIVTKSIPLSFENFHAACSASVFDKTYHSWYKHYVANNYIPYTSDRMIKMEKYIIWRLQQWRVTSTFRHTKAINSNMSPRVEPQTVVRILAESVFHSERKIIYMYGSWIILEAFTNNSILKHICLSYHIASNNIGEDTCTRLGKSKLWEVENMALCLAINVRYLCLFTDFWNRKPFLINHNSRR